MSIIYKITYGCVRQAFDAKTGEFSSQDFNAGDEVEWKDIEGQVISFPENEVEFYYPFEMIQNRDKTEKEICRVDVTFGDKQTIEDRKNPAKQTFSFNSRKECDTFIHGLRLGVGWIDCQINGIPVSDAL